MILRMAAGQQKKRLNAASVIRLNLHECDRVKKKKKLQSSDKVLNMTARVSLEWDDSQNSVVANKEQVGITWRDMAPFLDSVTQSHSALADVFSVPQEIFELENLTEVLSYEVWKTYLSESERKFLIQLLPRGTDMDQVVPSLLAGENIHFGNPLCKWGASLCAGNLHPDAVLRMECHLRVNRNIYISELREYHIEIIENLAKLKERWISCKNPEKEIVDKLWRKGVTKTMHGTSSVASEQAKIVPNSKKEQAQKICVRYGDAAKYMSYVKISRKQHQLIKNIKHSGDGILSKSLNCVLGDIKDFDVQPYEAFEEEEKQRMHEHWFQLANKDLPAAFEDHRKCRLLRDQWWKSVEQELREKRKLIMEMDEEKENLKCSTFKQVVDGESEQQSAVEMQERGHIQSLHCDDGCHLATSPSLNCHQESSHTAPDQEGSPDVLEPVDTSPVLSKFVGHENAAEAIMESKSSPSTDGLHLERIPSLNSSHQEFSTMVVDEGNQEMLKSADTSPVVSQFLGNMTTTENFVEPKDCISSSKDIWPAVGIEDAHYHPTSGSRGYASAGELSLRQTQHIEVRTTRLIDLESQILDREAAGSVVSASCMDNRANMFSPYSNQDHDLLLPAYDKGQEMLPSYPEEHLDGLKQRELQFFAANDSLSRSSLFPHQFQEQQQRLLEQRQTREKELYMQQTMNKSVYSNGRFPSQGCLSFVDSQNWTNFQSPVNGGLIGHNWYPGEHGTRNGWSGIEPSGAVDQCLGDGGNADGSLFSVLSECNKFPSHPPYGTASAEQSISGNFVGGCSSHDDGIFTYAPHLNNTSSQDVAALKMNNMPWTNFPRQNPGVPDSTGKSFLRSWNL